MINKEKFKDLMSKYIKSLENLTLSMDKLGEFCQVNEDHFDNFYSHTGLIEEIIGLMVGDEAEWIGWYVWENDMREKGSEAGYKDNMREIKNLDDLYWLITTKK